MSLQTWEETLGAATSTATAVANTTTETVVVPNFTIPANYMQNNRVLRLTLYGSYGTTATPTLAFALRWGGVAGTVIAKSTAVTTTSAVGAGASMTAPWSMIVDIQVRSNGSSGTLFTMGMATLFNSTAATSGTVTNYGLPMPIVSGSTGGTTPVAVTVDLTADTALSVTATWGTANSANSIQATNYTIETLN